MLASRWKLGIQEMEKRPPQKLQRHRTGWSWGAVMVSETPRKLNPTRAPVGARWVRPRAEPLTPTPRQFL